MKEPQRQQDYLKAKYLDMQPCLKSVDAREKVDEVFNWFVEELEQARQEEREKVLEIWEIVKEHGTLKVPNPYGKTVKVERHNQVIGEMDGLFRQQIKEMK